MIVYIVMIFITIVFAIGYDYAVRTTLKNILIWKMFFLCMCIPTIFVSAIRYYVGVDYGIYWKFYEAVKVGRNTVTGSKVSMEIGLRMIDSVLLQFSDSPITFFFLSSALIYLSIFGYIKKQQEKIMPSVMCFFLSGMYFTSLNIVRQFIAIAIVLWGLKYLKKNKIVPYIICCIFASLFHLSSLIMVVFCFIQYGNMTRKKFVSIFVVMLCMAPITKIVFELIIANTRYSYYLNNNLYAVDYDLAGTIYAVLLTAYAFWRYKTCEKNYAFNFNLTVLLCYDIAICMSYFIPLSSRVSIYFKLFVFLDLLPMLINSHSSKVEKVFMALMWFVFMGATTIFMYYVRGNSGVFPYMTIWSC